MLPCTPTAEIIRSAVIFSTLPSFISTWAVTEFAPFSTFVTLASSMIFMPCFSNCFLAKCGNLGVLDRHDRRHQLDHGHLDAHGAVEGGELDADGARAHDQQRLRHLRRHHRLEIGPDQLAVRLDAGQRARPRAGRDDDVLGRVGALAQRVLRQRRLRLHRLLGRLADDDLAAAWSSLASPQMTSTLFFFIRKPTPPFMRCAMPRERSTTALTSALIVPSIFRP